MACSHWISITEVLCKYYRLPQASQTSSYQFPKTFLFSSVLYLSCTCTLILILEMKWGCMNMLTNCCLYFYSLTSDTIQPDSAILIYNMQRLIRTLGSFNQTYFKQKGILMQRKLNCTGLHVSGSIRMVMCPFFIIFNNMWNTLQHTTTVSLLKI